MFYDNQFRMHKPVFILFLFFFASVSCVHEPLAQDLPSLQGTRWGYVESEVREDGTSYTYTMHLHFWDEEMVILFHEYEERTPFEIISSEEETRYIYRYDLSVKQGIFIHDKEESAIFELRGNLLFLVMGHLSDAYVFRRE